MPTSEIIRASHMLIFKGLDHETADGFSLTNLRGIETLYGSFGRLQYNRFWVLLGNSVISLSQWKVCDRTATG